MSLVVWLLTGLSTIAIGLALVSAVLARRALVASEERWSDSLAVHKIELLRSEVANLQDLYDHQTKLYRRLTARQGKRDKQASTPAPKEAEPEAPPSAEHDLPLASGEPSPHTQPEQWKRWKRAQLATARLSRG